MAETAQTMTEFTYAPGEKNIVGDRFSPSVSILEKDKLMSLAQEIQTRVFTDADQLRHEESMHMAEKQYTAQTNSVLIQQQMLANQQTQAEQQTQAPAQSEQNQPGE